MVVICEIIQSFYSEKIWLLTWLDVIKQRSNAVIMVLRKLKSYPIAFKNSLETIAGWNPIYISGIDRHILEVFKYDGYGPRIDTHQCGQNDLYEFCELTIKFYLYWSIINPLYFDLFLCYKNNANLPTPFQGNMAHAVERQKYVNKPSLPYYAHAYGNIISGEMIRNVS